MSSEVMTGGFSGDPAEAFRPPAASGCCGGEPVNEVAGGCCGEVAEESVATNVSCC
jgi:hypothetical protein